MKQLRELLNAGEKAIMSGNLVKLAQRFVRLSGELDATRDAMKRLLLNGAGTASENPTPARRPGAKRAAGRKRDIAIRVMVTAKEQAEIRKAANKAAMPMSVYVLAKALEASRGAR